MDRYLALQVFQQVAALESFAAAGRRLGLSAPAVSKNIAALEAHLGVRLINRSTRRMALTDEGRIYLAHVSRGLEALADGELALDPLRQQPRGTLRVAAPLSVTLSRLSARVPDFLARHPSLRLELDLDDRRVDLIREGFDLALRGSDRLEDSSLVARKLVDLPHVLCGRSPADFSFRLVRPNHGCWRTVHQCFCAKALRNLVRVGCILAHRNILNRYFRTQNHRG